MILTLDLKTPSLNDWYSGSHWSKRSELKKVWRKNVFALCHQENIKPFTKFPLRITTRPMYKDKRKRDTDNTVTAAKLFIDAIKHQGLIPDDTPEYIETIVLCSPVLGCEINKTLIQIEVID